jgi:hypothetical protein
VGSCFYRASSLISLPNPYGVNIGKVASKVKFTTLAMSLIVYSLHKGCSIGLPSSILENLLTCSAKYLSLMEDTSQTIISPFFAPNKSNIPGVNAIEFPITISISSPVVNVFYIIGD